ncbi:MAG: hypothetical protein K6T90_03935 [Leptolyngbyaceae cyanobacterium HOT.MB2.61]|jgi:hypothetical protein|nr:hypothetical protein [Leptolyngbyaceae cyanobacterium HOT.MB2.61]
MSNPLRPLKFLPWRSLFQAALLTAVIVIFLEFILFVATQQFPDLKAFIEKALVPTLGIILSVATGVGVGALAVVILERSGCPAMNTNSLWGLVACIFLIFLVRRFFPLPTLLFDVDPAHIVSMIVGVFWKGRSYWRW